MVFMKDDIGEKLKEERLKRKYPFEEMNNSITINAIGVRESILRFAVAMEEEMRKKDKKYADDSYRKNRDFLINHLKEERDEVDHELYLSKAGDKFFVKTELIHEAIMCMLVSDVI